MIIPIPFIESEDIKVSRKPKEKDESTKEYGDKNIDKKLTIVEKNNVKRKKRTTKEMENQIISTDPFLINMNPTEGELDQATWFMNLVQDIKGDYHNRRIHYRTLGKIKPNGEIYRNIDKDTAYMNDASLLARYLGMVDWNRVKDHKNEDVVHFTIYNSDMIPVLILEENKNKFNQFKELDSRDIIKVKDERNNYIADGTKFVDASSRQKYHLELWIEKSTLGDILSTIIKKYNMTLTVASGQFSFTQVINLWERIMMLRMKEWINKKVIIFYLRDFDPAGENMPIAVARKLEWLVRTGGDPHNDVDKGGLPHGLDIRLVDLGLNYDQCLKYELPRQPIDTKKESYRAEFEKKFGEGATELDSWAALKEDEFVRYLEEKIGIYFDDTLEKKINEFNHEENKRLEEYKTKVLEGFKELYTELVEEFNVKVKELREISEKITEAINGTSVKGEFKLRDAPVSRLELDDSKQIYILDTRRSYDIQLKVYQILQR